MSFLRKALSFGIKLEALQLAFAAGAISGMLYMALLMVVPGLARMIVGRL